MEETIYAFVAEAIQEINERSDPDQQVPMTPETVILGEDSSLDSMGIISLTVAVEQRIDTRMNLELNLTEGILDLDTDRLTIGGFVHMITERMG